MCSPKKSSFETAPRVSLSKQTNNWSSRMLVLKKVLLLFVLASSFCTFHVLRLFDTQAEISEATSRDVPQGFVHSNKIYGHVHIAKTAGTYLNGLLSTQFERVCGHKGYSYDSFQTNERFHHSKYRDIQRSSDSISAIHRDYGRVRVPFNIMDEIGYENCDYVSQETTWKWWGERFSSFHDLELELHVPCRDPIDHLMSQCNYLELDFQCRPDDDRDLTAFLKKQIRKCMIEHDRFDMTLTEHFDVRCFDFRESSNGYMAYMSNKLQRKRITSDFWHRETNKQRNKASECVWSDKRARKILDHELMKLDYYAFCSECLHSDKDLLHGMQTDHQRWRDDNRLWPCYKAQQTLFAVVSRLSTRFVEQHGMSCSTWNNVHFR